MSTQTVFKEKDLSEKLGIPRDTFKKARADKLEEGRDWFKREGAICITARSIFRVLVTVGVTEITSAMQEAIMACAFTSTEPEAPPECLHKANPTESLLVHSKPRNSRIVMAEIPRKVNTPKGKYYVPESGVVRVRVRSNKNFVAGMIIQCTCVQEDLWDLVGRAPRGRRDPRMY